MLVGFVSFAVWIGPLHARPESSRWNRQGAVEAYQEAVQLYGELHRAPADSRTQKDYVRVINRFEAVLRLDPHYSRCDDSLFQIGQLHIELGGLLGGKEHYDKAIRTYQFLLKNYPASPLCPEALLTVGDLYLVKLKTAEEARQIFEQVQIRYPRSSFAREAAARLQDISKPGPPVSAPPREASKVANVRYWSTDRYTRVVVDLTREVNFQKQRLPDPERIYFDLVGAELSPELRGKVFLVNDAFLKQIRVAQFRAGTVRVVLDFAKPIQYTVFELYNPYRIVTDIREVAPTKALASKSRRTDSKAINHDEKGEKGREAEATEAVSLAVKKPESAAANEGLLPPPRVASPTSDGSRTLTRTLGLKIGRIVLDPGHGGHDTGTVGRNGLQEKDLVLDVAFELKKLLEDQMGAEVILTRTDDSFVSLEERTGMANSREADLFVSIHANSSRNRSIRGVETFFLNFAISEEAREVAARENASSQKNIRDLQNLVKKITLYEKLGESKEFAAVVQKSLHRTLIQSRSRVPNRGIKQAPFIVLIGANMPSILTEISFISNAADERFLLKGANRLRVAEGLSRGIQSYAATLGMTASAVPTNSR